MKTSDFVKRIMDFTISVHDVTDAIRIAVKPEIVTHQQYRILEMIYLNMTSSVGEVCKCLGISLPNTSREIKKLLKLGLIEKMPHPSDGRRFTITLTGDGTLIMEDAFRKVNQIFEEKLVELSLSEQEEVKKSIDILMRKLYN